MHSILAELFKPPAIKGNLLERDRVNLINQITLAMLAATFVGVFVAIFSHRYPISIIFIAVTSLAVFTAVRVLFKAGYINATSYLLVTFGLFFAAAGVAAKGTLRTTGLLYFPVSITIAVLLFNLRGFIITTAISSLQILGLVFAQKAGLLPEPDHTVGFSQWIFASVLLALIAYLVFFAKNTTRKAIKAMDLEIQERTRAEHALEEANALLEQRVRERTVELKKANTALEKAVIARDAFLRAVTHELRTPLTGILGMAQALQMPGMGDLSPNQASAAQHIEENGRRLNDLIKNVLVYTQMQSGYLSPQKHPFPIGMLCRNILNNYEARANERGLTFQFSILPEEITCNQDEQIVQKAIDHLIDNAVKFTPQGGSVGIDVTDAPNDVHISVWDSGSGMRPEDIGRIFEPFSQADDGIGRQYSGIGLGLPLARLSVELMGGSIEVESDTGKGSRFTITLPKNLPA